MTFKMTAFHTIQKLYKPKTEQKNHQNRFVYTISNGEKMTISKTLQKLYKSKTSAYTD